MSFASRFLNAVEKKKYPIDELEKLAVVFGLNIFVIYLEDILQS